MPLDDVRELKGVLGCTVNDVVLATVAGAMRRYLFRRRVDHRKLDFRVATPVSMRREEHERRQGNHVSSWIVPLPLEVDDPLARLEMLKERTRELKRSEAALAVDTLMQVAELLPAPLIARSIDLVRGPANMIVTNVPGPQFPLYMLGARMLGMYPTVPLLPGGGLGIALFSYEGKLCWGFNGDYELVPDLRDLVDDVRVAFEELRAGAVTRFIELRTARAEIEMQEGDEQARPIEVPVREGKPRARRRKARRAQANGRVADAAPADRTPEATAAP
jgi:WS/DGAT/MGAT family acyltransferase